MLVSDLAGSQIPPAATLIKRSRQIPTQVLGILQTHRQPKDSISREFPVRLQGIARKVVTGRHEVIGSQPTDQTAVMPQ